VLQCRNAPVRVDASCCCSVLQRFAVCCSLLQCRSAPVRRTPVVVTVRCCVLQCVAVCCSALRCRNAPVCADACPADTTKHLCSLSDSTVFFCLFVHFHLIIVIRRNFFVPFRYQRPKGKSAGPALKYFNMIRRVGRCCSELQSFAECCSVLRCVALFCAVLQSAAACCSELHSVAECYIVGQCLEMSRNLSHCAAVVCILLQSTVCADIF